MMHFRPNIAQARYNADPMDEPLKRRRWFKFHLSTAVVLLLLIGLLLWLNTSLYQIPGSRGGYARWRVYGWPIPCGWDPNADRMREEAHLLRIRYGEFRVIWNVLANLAIVVAVAVMCETRIRRREARKP